MTTGSMLLKIYTEIHTLISLVGIVSGFVVVWGFLSSERLPGWTRVFLATTLATNITGFLFPFHGWKPSYTVGVISTVILLVAYVALYRMQLAGAWRAIYVLCATAALYLNTFVLVVQSFLKVPALHALAPTLSEPPFKLTQLTVLVLFVILGIVGVIRFQIGDVRDRFSGPVPAR